jgi:uncharacterized repeat protein (TIGR01451 family)
MVLDTIKPTVTAKTSEYVFGTNVDCFRLEETLIDDFTIADNCQAGLQVSWRSEHPNGTVPGSDSASLKAHRYPRGSSTLTVIVEDLSGNKDSASVTVEVKDVEPPVLTIPSDLATIYVACADDVPAPNNDRFVVTDNCANPATITINHLSDVVKDSTDIYHYTIQRKWQAYDDAGDDDVMGDGQHSLEVIQYIIIKDTIAPVLDDDPARLQPVINCANYEADIEAMEQLVPVFADNCDKSTLVPEIVQRDTIPDNGKIIIKRTWVAKDASGNEGPWVQTIELPSNDLEVTLKASVKEGYKGDQVEYVVTVINKGSCDVNATAKSQLPPELKYLSHNPAAADYVEATGIWTVGLLAPQASATLAINALIVSALEDSIRVSAHVDIDPLSNAIVMPETRYDNNDTVVGVKGKGYAVRISKWLDSGDAATINDVVTFIIRVESRTNVNNTDLWVRDILPPGLQLEPLTNQSAILEPNGVKIPVPTLNDGQHYDIIVNARVTDAAGDSVINYAEVFRNSAPEIILDSTTVTLYTTKPDLAITASVIDAKETTGNKSYMVDREYTFLVNYSNIGALPVRQATLTASFNPTRQRVLYANNSGVVANNSGIVTWQLTDILKSAPERSVEMRVEPLLPGASTVTFYIDTKEVEWPKYNNRDTIVIDQHIWVIPNVLTDNGENTVLHIPQLEDPKYHVAQARFTVYNTWGNMVYRNRNYKGISQEEKFSGRNLSKGTYYYELIVEFDDGTSTVIKDWIMILK